MSVWDPWPLRSGPWLVRFFGFYLKVSPAKKGHSIGFSPPRPCAFISTSVFGISHLSCRFLVEELQWGRIHKLLVRERCDLRWLRHLWKLPWLAWVSCLLLLLLVVMDYLILISHLHILILVDVVTATQQHKKPNLWQTVRRIVTAETRAERWGGGHKIWGWLTKWSQQVPVQRSNEGGIKVKRGNRGITSQACGKGAVTTGVNLKVRQQPSIQGLTTGRCYWGFVTHWWCLLPRGLKQRRVHVCLKPPTIFFVDIFILTFSVKLFLISVIASKQTFM